MGRAPSLVTAPRSLLNGVHLGKGGDRLSKGTKKQKKAPPEVPRASISLFIKLHSIAGRQQGEQSGTAQQHWQGACGVRGTILCEPERRCQGQGGVGSEEDRTGKLSSYK